MALCPFHEDHHPSLKLDQRYYCFGCHATGDVIDFTARLFGISQKSAALKLARDFGIDPRPPTQSDIPILNAEPLPNPEQPCILSLAEEVHRLRYWESAYAPKSLDDPYDARFVERWMWNGRASRASSECCTAVSCASAKGNSAPCMTVPTVFTAARSS